MHIKPATPGNQWNWAESIKTIAADSSRSGFAPLSLVIALQSTEAVSSSREGATLWEWGLSDTVFLTLRGDFWKNYSPFLGTARWIPAGRTWFQSCVKHCVLKIFTAFGLKSHFFCPNYMTDRKCYIESNMLLYEWHFYFMCLTVLIHTHVWLTPKLVRRVLGPLGLELWKVMNHL